MIYHYKHRSSAVFVNGVFKRVADTAAQIPFNQIFSDRLKITQMTIEAGFSASASDFSKMEEVKR